MQISRPDPWQATASELVLLDSKAKLAAMALEHRELTNRLSYQAQHDPLTGLPNRALLEDRLRQAITLARRQAKMVANWSSCSRGMRTPANRPTPVFTA